MALPTIPAYTLPDPDALPAARAPWQPAAERCVLLVHDMQRYFLAAFDAGAEPLIVEEMYLEGATPPDMTALAR